MTGGNDIGENTNPARQALLTGLGLVSLPTADGSSASEPKQLAETTPETRLAVSVVPAVVGRRRAMLGMGAGVSQAAVLPLGALSAAEQIAELQRQLAAANAATAAAQAALAEQTAATEAANTALTAAQNQANRFQHKLTEGFLVSSSLNCRELAEAAGYRGINEVHEAMRKVLDLPDWFNVITTPESRPRRDQLALQYRRLGEVVEWRNKGVKRLAEVLGILAEGGGTQDPEFVKAMNDRMSYYKLDQQPRTLEEILPPEQYREMQQRCDALDLLGATAHKVGCVIKGMEGMQHIEHPSFDLGVTSISINYTQTGAVAKGIYTQLRKEQGDDEFWQNAPASAILKLANRYAEEVPKAVRAAVDAHLAAEEIRVREAIEQCHATHKHLTPEQAASAIAELEGAGKTAQERISAAVKTVEQITAGLLQSIAKIEAGVGVIEEVARKVDVVANTVANVADVATAANISSQTPPLAIEQQPAESVLWADGVRKEDVALLRDGR